jgi:hypothetical protein
VKTKVHPQFKDEQFWNVLHPDEMKRTIREMIDKGERTRRHVLLGEMLRDIINKDGGLDYFPFPSERRGDKPIIREMIDTSQGQMALLEKVRIDVAFGLADIPLLYGPLYDRIAPAGGFPGGVYQLDEYTLSAQRRLPSEV